MPFIKDYPDGNNIYEWDGRHIKSYENGSRSLEIYGPVPLAITIAVSTGMI